LVASSLGLIMAGPTSSAAPLSAEIDESLQRLGQADFRARKIAAERLLNLVTVATDDLPLRRAVVVRLLDGLLDERSIAARASSHEVLVRFGVPAPAMARARLAEASATQATRAPRRNVLIDLLAEIGDASDVDRLRVFAEDEAEDENVRASAIAAIATLGGPAQSERLVHLLDVPQPMLRLYVLDALRESGARVTPERIAPLLADSVSRRAAAELLGSSVAAEAVPLLVPLLTDSMIGVRAAASVSLYRLHRGLAGGPSAQVIPRAMGGVGPATREQIRGLIVRDDPAVRVAAIQLAAMAGDPEALANIIEVTDDPSAFDAGLDFVARVGARCNPVLVRVADNVGPEHRPSFLRLIAALSPESIDQALLATVLAALEERNEEVALAACETLDSIGGRTAMAPLYRRCGDEGDLGERAADALSSIAARVGGAGYDDLMLIIGGTWPETGASARNLCRVVGRLGILDFVPPLVSMLGSSDVGVRVAAALSLGQIPGEHEGVGALCFALADEEPPVRAAACRSLGSLAVPRACGPLLGATEDPTPLVRSAAVQALVAIDNPVSLSRLRDLVLDDPSPSVIVHAVAGLGRSRKNEDLSLLMSLCTASDHEVVKAAARALKSYREHRATAALLHLLGHERWDVRWAAAEVLADRGDATARDPLQRALEIESDALVAEVIERAITDLDAAGGREEGLA
jgi:HEAT repeat protein